MGLGTTDSAVPSTETFGPLLPLVVFSDGMELVSRSRPDLEADTTSTVNSRRKNGSLGALYFTLQTNRL